MTITEKQEKLIKKEIYKSRNLPDKMKEELLDHFCCVIDNKMQKGIVFDDALRIAFDEISPNGLDEIHHETVFLLSPQKVSLMKKSVRINGIIFLIAAPVGIYFKYNHLVAANLIIFLSAACLLFGFLPAFFINSYKADLVKHMSAKYKNIAGYSSLSLVVIGFVMWLIRMEGSAVALFVGFGLFVMGFLPFFYFKKL